MTTTQERAAGTARRVSERHDEMRRVRSYGGLTRSRSRFHATPPPWLEQRPWVLRQTCSHHLLILPSSMRVDCSRPAHARQPPAAATMPSWRPPDVLQRVAAAVRGERWHRCIVGVRGAAGGQDWSSCWYITSKEEDTHHTLLLLEVALKLALTLLLRALRDALLTPHRVIVGLGGVVQVAHRLEQSARR